MTVVPHRRYAAEHAAADRLDSPIGHEIVRLTSEFEQITEEFTNNGAIDGHSIELARARLARLDMFGKIVALAGDLAEQSGFIRDLVESLANDKTAGAVDRAQDSINFYVQQLDDILSGVRTDA